MSTVVAHIGGAPVEEVLPGAIVLAGVALRMLRSKLHRAPVSPAKR